jgi:hypothetical protein
VGSKWGILLRAIGIPVPSSRLLSYQWVAEFFNNFLPAGWAATSCAAMPGQRHPSHRRCHGQRVLIDRFMGLFIFMLSRLWPR